MSWSMLEMLKPLKKIRSRVLSGLESRDECTPARFLNNT